MAALLAGPPPRPFVLFALHREASPFRRQLRGGHKVRSAPCPALLGTAASGDILIAVTGPGEPSTNAALSWLLSPEAPCLPSVVVAAGFCGSLQASLHSTDLILATEVLHLEGTAWQTTWPADVPAACPQIQPARLVSIPSPVTSREAKMTLARRSGAAAVDMESAAAARICSEHGVPFGCLRAVSDDVDTPLSAELLECVPGGRVSASRLSRLLLRHPRVTKDLWLLARTTRGASQRLAVALNHCLRQPAKPARPFPACPPASPSARL